MTAAIRVGIALIAWFSVLSSLGTARLLALVAVLSLLAVGWTWLRRFPLLLAWRHHLVARPLLPLILTIVTAFAIRVFYVLSQEGGLPSIQQADAANYWQWAGEFAAGAFPDVKCWTAPAGYALVRLCFGDSLLAAVCLNFMLQVITAVVLYLFGKRVFGTVSGLLAAAVYLLSPTFVVMWGMTIAEHFFVLFVALAFYVLARWHESLCVRWAILLPVLTWLAIWTRGEGVLLMGVVFVWALVRFCAEKDDRRRLLAGLCVFVLMLAFGACVGVSVNRCCHGTRTAFCSNDNYWPRLHGADLSTHGRVTGKGYIKRLYLADHPDDPGGVIANMRPQTCPKELIPYIEREIRRRWAAMSLGTKIGFVFEKERYVWTQSFMGNGRPEPPRTRREWFSRVGQELIPAAVCLLAFVGCWRLFREHDLRSLSVKLAPACYLLGMVAVLAVYESNVRYGYMLTVALSFYAGMALWEVTGENPS